MAQDDDRPEQGIEALPDHPVTDGDRIGIAPLPGERPPPPSSQRPIPPAEPEPSEEIRIALERARLVVADLESVLGPAAQALRDGAWVSRSADDFSLELDGHARQCGVIGERAIEAIEELARRPKPDDGLETLPLYPQYGPIQGYGI